MFGSLEGHVVEIGPGPGTNLPFFRPGIRWTGVEPNQFMDRYIAEAARQLGMTAEVRRGSAEDLPFLTGSVDAVVSSLVLCSVPDPGRVLAEVRRVLRPGGRFAFIEHVAAPRQSGLRKAQRLVRPLWSLLADGCQTDRETWQTIAQAGFARLELEHFRAPVPLVGPHIAGVATT